MIRKKNKIPVESIAPKTKMEVYWRCKKDILGKIKYKIK